MRAAADNTTTSLSAQAASPAHRPAGRLVSSWSQGRRRFTPYAYPHLRGLGVTRLAVGLFLAALGAVFISQDHDGLAIVPLAGAALVLAIGCLDLRAARLTPRRS